MAQQGAEHWQETSSAISEMNNILHFKDKPFALNNNSGNHWKACCYLVENLMLVEGPSLLLQLSRRCGSTVSLRESGHGSGRRGGMKGGQ